MSQLVTIAQVAQLPVIISGLDARVAGLETVPGVDITGLAPLNNPAFTGTATFASRPTFSGNAPWDAGNFNPGLYALSNTPSFTGIPSAPTATPGTNTTQLATTAFITEAISGLLSASTATSTYFTIASAASKANLASPAFTGVATFAARPTFNGQTPWDSGNFTPATFAALSSPTFTGVPLAPTATPGANSTQIATTAFVTVALGGYLTIANAALKANLASPAFTGAATFATRPTFNGATPWDSSNFTPSTAEPVFDPILVTGTGIAQVVTLPVSGLTATQVLVSVEGLIQRPGTFTISGDQLTITVPATAEIVVISLSPPKAVPTSGPMNSPSVTSSTTTARTLVASPGTWVEAGTPTVQWKKNGTNIAGATTRDLLLTDSDLGATITCVESLAGMDSVSNAITPVRVMMTFGQSNDLGARNNLTELPAGYLTTDPNFKIWKVDTQTIATLVPGPMELQPGLSFVDPDYPNTVGPLGEFIKFFRTENAPSVVVHAFNYVIGGGRFSDASSLGRAANWLTSLTDGAWSGMKTQWDAYCSAANAQNIAPYVVQVNTALGYSSAENSTEASAYQAEMSSLIGDIRTKIGGDARFVIERVSSAVTGFSSSAAVRNAQKNIVLADPTRVQMVNMDGAQIGSVDAVHFTASTFMFSGEARFYHLTNKWYPERDIAEIGATIYPSAVYRAGDLRNVKVPGLFRIWDSSGRERHMDQDNSARESTLTTTTLANGLVVRKNIFGGPPSGGATDYVKTGSSFAFAQAGGYACLSAVSATTTGNAVLAGEASSSSIFPLATHLAGNASGALTVVYRDESDTIPNGMTFPVLIAGAFNGTTNFIAMTDTGTAVQGHVNGASGSPITYARGTGSYATNQTSIGALEQLSGSDPFLPIAATVGIIWYTNTAPDSNYLAKARAFTQYRYGTI